MKNTQKCFCSICYRQTEPEFLCDMCDYYYCEDCSYQFTLHYQFQGTRCYRCAEQRRLSTLDKIEVRNNKLRCLEEDGVVEPED